MERSLHTLTTAIRRRWDYQRSTAIALLKVGQKIFEYEIVRKLGQGGFAAVFEAHDRLINRRVAIKQLSVDRVGNQRIVKRFIQEARVAASLEHPNVVSIYGLRIEGNELFMIMEYLSHGSLRDLINKQGKLPVEKTVAFAIGVCEGLVKFHQKGIIHRDIKSENILLTADGRPKIIDFGIAHVPEAQGGMALTQAGFQPSTLLYSSPEQMQGHTLDARSDVYQIGSLLYYMLTGAPPISLDELEQQAKTGQSESITEFQIQTRLYQLLEQMICHEQPRGLQQLWREVGVLAGVVEKAMAKDPIDRFANTADFAAALKAINITAVPEKKEPQSLTLRDSRVFNRRGLAYANMRNFEQAIFDYTKAIELDRHYAEAYNNRSAAHLMMENYAKAVMDCNWALELAPHFVAAHVNLGIAHTGLRQYQPALQDYAQALALDADNIYAYYNRGNTRLWMKDYEQALDDFEQALRLNPEFVAAYVNRGVAHTELKQYQPAMADFSRAIKLNPNYVYAYFNRANLFREMEQYEHAIKDYSMVIDLNPQHVTAIENRGDCYTALNRKEEASEDYTRVVLQTSSINPKRITVARSMLMSAIPVDL